MTNLQKDLLNELIKKQRKNTPQSVLLGFKDLNRIVNNIDKSIFDNECTIWKGFIHSYKNNYYINFFYKGSKKNLSRLLYYNFVGKIEESEYIKTTCENGGKCCNIKHYQKFKKEHNNNIHDNMGIQNSINENNEDINDKNDKDKNDEDKNDEDKNDKDKNDKDKNDKDKNDKDKNDEDKNDKDKNDEENIDNNDMDYFKVIF